MIDPPTAHPESPERKVELDQTVDFAIQLLVEEGHLVGWTRVEFLTAVLDAANNGCRRSKKSANLKRTTREDRDLQLQRRQWQAGNLTALAGSMITGEAMRQTVWS
jgi:hypothetical protein